MFLNLISLMNNVEKLMKIVDETIDEIFDMFEGETKSKKRDYMDAEIIQEKEVSRS